MTWQPEEKLFYYKIENRVLKSIYSKIIKEIDNDFYEIQDHDGFTHIMRKLYFHKVNEPNELLKDLLSTNSPN